MLEKAVMAAILTVLHIGLCHAEPPPAGSEQDAILAPHSDWVKGLMNPYTRQGCCDLSDCRVVSARIRSNHYQAFIGRDVYGEGAPDGWLDVPDDVVITDRTNPVGMPVACWRASRQPLYNGFFCFQGGPGT